MPQSQQLLALVQPFSLVALPSSWEEQLSFWQMPSKPLSFSELRLVFWVELSSFKALWVQRSESLQNSQIQIQLVRDLSLLL